MGAALHLFAGKGGAGKTTLAAAMAATLSEGGKGERVLLVARDSLDLAQLLKVELGEVPAKVMSGKGERNGVWASELPRDAVAAQTESLKLLIRQCAVKGIVLNEDEVSRILLSSIPTNSAVGLFFALEQLLESKDWDRIVVDVGSLASFTQLLEYPRRLRRVADIIRGVKSKGKAHAKPAPKAEELATRADRVLTLLRDPERTAIHLIAIPEPLVEAQVKWFLKWMADHAFPVADITINLIESGKPSRETANRRGLQAPHVRKYQSLHPRVYLVERRVVGPMGLEDIRKFAREIATGKETKLLAFSPAESPPALVRAPSMPPIAAPAIPPTRFLFFVGAGGVGKTSCAAAAAVTLTEKEGPVLLVSADPAHGLSEAVQGRLGDTEIQVKGTKGLYAREFDFGDWETRLRKLVREFAEPMYGAESRSDAFAMDRELVRQLVDFLPPLMEEWGPVVALTFALTQERFKRIVVDVPPGPLRMLDYIPVAREYFATLRGVLHRHRSKGAAKFLEWLQAQEKGLERFEAALHNPNECRIVVVTRGEEMAVASALNSLEVLKSHRLPVERLIVNQVLPKTSCAATEEMRNGQLEVARTFEKRAGFPVTLAPALGRHPSGLRELKGFRTSWYAVAAIGKSTKAA